MPDSAIPCVVIHSDTHVATATSWKSAASKERAQAYRERYLTVAATMVVDCGDCVHLVVDATPRAEGDARRRVIMVADGVSMAKFMENMGIQVHRHDAIVAVPPDIRPPSARDEGDFREQVATDLAYVIERLYPIRAQGPIAPMIPWLARLAGSILLRGASSPGEQGAIVRRALARHLTYASMEAFDSWNARAEFLTAYPAWPYLAEEVAHGAMEASMALTSGHTMEGAAVLIRGIMGKALENMEIQTPSKAA